MAKSQQISHLSLIGIVFGIVALAICLYAISQSTEYREQAAQGAVLYLISKPTTAIAGQNVAVTVDVDTNNVPIQTVVVNLTYPTSKVDLLQIDTTNSPFDTSTGDIHGNGYINLGRQASFAVTGRNHVATLHFKAKAPIDLSDIQPVSGTEILSTNNQNIFTNAVARTEEITRAQSQSGFSIDFFFSLFRSVFNRK